MSIQGFKILSHPAFGKLRVIRTGSGIWFVAEDVCKALEYDDPKLAVSKYVEEYQKKRIVIPALQSNKNTLMVNTRGVQGLCFFSQSNKASKFTDWIWYHVIRAAFPEYYRKDG